jgi:hypothetical protein
MTPEDCPMATTPEKDRRKLHFNRGINLDTIILMLVMLGGFVKWSNSWTEEITANKAGLKAEHDINIRQDVEKATQDSRTEAWMVRMENKMDRVLQDKRR